MSSTVPPYLFEAPGNHDAPFTFTVAASLEVQPYTAHAIFDGTNASGDFRPCLTFYSADGVRLGRYFPANVVTAGDVQEVTYTPPFGTAPVSSSTGGSGIQYDTLNVGDWLDVQVAANDPHIASGSIYLHNSGDDLVQTLLRVSEEQTNPATSGAIGMQLDTTVDDGFSGHVATGMIVSAGQYGGGDAVPIQVNSSAGARVIGVLIALTGDAGANLIGVQTNAPIVFTADQGPATGTPVKAQLYLKSAGGGQNSLVARAGTTEVTLVTG